jgi:hypothetical protein
MAIPSVLHRSFAFIALLALVLLTALVANGRITAGQSSAAAAVGPCGSGTAFFGSAPVNTQFVQGDTWQGATFTHIDSDPDRMNVRLVATGDLVGRFPSVTGGATATIVFPQPVMVTGILWYGNHPPGWSLNGIAGPDTGSDSAGACTATSFVTDTITIWSDESGGIDFWFDPVRGGEGCTPGYWKNHEDSWPATGYYTGQSLESVFDLPDALGYDNVTLHNALKFGGGPGVQGGARILLRAAVASLLNSAHPGVDFAMTTADVIADVNAALASGSRATMISLAGDLDDANNALEGCPLN